MSREYDQQELVNSIVQSLYKLAKDDRDLKDLFASVARACITRLYVQPAFGSSIELVSFVINPIERFTKNENEQRVLLSRVLVKLVASLATIDEQKWLRECWLRKSTQEEK